MIRWLQKLMDATSEREHYEAEIRREQHDKLVHYVEQSKQEIDERVAYLEATAKVLQQAEAQAYRRDHPTDDSR